jgi:hypothetical protein
VRCGREQQAGGENERAGDAHTPMIR